MLSYQHAYHAGCLADVHKHAAQAMLLEVLIKQSPRLTYMETHSGRGLYRLNSAEAEKTGEAKAGVLRLLAEGKLPHSLAYTRLLDQTRRMHGEHAYPGSPFIARLLLRPEDRLHLFELHPAEGVALIRQVKGRNIRVYKEDGYAGVMRLCPPVPRNGMVLIDPSFEMKTEYRQAAEMMKRLRRKWPDATVMLWYPMLKAGLHEGMVEMLKEQRLPGFWHQGIRFCAPEEVRGMYGSGLAIMNLPDAAREALDALPKLFSHLVTLRKGTGYVAG